MKNIILTGSIAFDHLMKFNGNFKNSILEGELDCLSVSFLAQDREIFNGGCATNVAYVLRLLEESPVVVGVAGNDFSEYKEFLENCGVCTDCIQISSSAPTAAAFVLTDNSQNQISIFSSGAMADTSLCMGLEKCKNVKETFCALISPGIPERMIAMAQACIDKEIPFIFDPGQAIGALDSGSLALLVDCCWGLIVNQYESELLEDKLNLSIKQIANRAGFLIVTLGSEGCCFYKEGVKESILAISDLDVVDVTGAGDAFRAGLIYGLRHGGDLSQACKIANTVASFSVSSKGTQTYRFTLDDVKSRLEKYYD